MSESSTERSRDWKVYGPDLNGRFGGLQGTGGLEAVVLDASGTTTGVINDQFGNGVATVSGGSVTWNTTRVGAYGPLPGIQAQTLTDVSQLAAATAWRSRRIDPTGFYWLGARYYEPTSGRFLSADPAGHAASPSLYDYAGGDPVNHTDPDGRCQKLIDNFGQDAATQKFLSQSFGDVYAVNGFNAQNSGQNGDGFFGGAWNRLKDIAVGVYDLPRTIFYAPRDIAQAATTIAEDPAADWARSVAYAKAVWNDRTSSSYGWGKNAVDAALLAPLAFRLAGLASETSAASGSALAPENTVSLFHKGELLNGQVSGARALSTGLDFDSVNALNRPGQVFRFDVPRSILRGWEVNGQVARFLDFDVATGVQNAEMRREPRGSGFGVWG